MQYLEYQRQKVYRISLISPYNLVLHTQLFGFFDINNKLINKASIPTRIFSP